ncbi:hypothetical protein DPEC_G00055430 [Dallia pectoralis]|uniref:Uncharacterized protein n=1 Tax=Dallia pectoralis TaxID=75939 RepID=A0ACC2H5B8_DALPE|nr:hypothetical protein DPEC_G00055430 [Dallia pectoralis]
MNFSTDSNSTLLVHVTGIYRFWPIWTAALTGEILLGLPINVYVLWMIVNSAGATVATEIFALNLSVSEIIFCLSAALKMLSIYLPVKSVALTSVGWFSLGSIFTSRPVFQCCICVERYLAVVHPVTFLKYRPLRYRLACSGLAWLIVLGFCLRYGLLADIRPPTAYLFLGFTLVVFSVMLFCCLAVLRALKRPRPGDGDREGTDGVKTKAFRIISVILVTMVINYLPMLILIPFEQNFDGDYIYLAIALFVVFMVVTGFVQPLLFLHKAGKLPCICSP